MLQWLRSERRFNWMLAALVAIPYLYYQWKEYRTPTALTIQDETDITKTLKLIEKDHPDLPLNELKRVIEGEVNIPPNALDTPQLNELFQKSLRSKKKKKKRSRQNKHRKRTPKRSRKRRSYT